MNGKKLYRSCNDRILGGVAGGLGEYLDIDPVLIRLVFILALFSGVGVLAYILAWIIIPEDPKCPTGKSAGDEIREKAESVASEVRSRTGRSRTDEDVRMLIGVIILALGVMFFVQTTIGPFVWKIFWPTILVLIGLYIIIRK
jgi:phage shock protein C